MNYPCRCKEMIWMMDNNEVFRKQEHHWMLIWKELDKDKNKGINIEQFGVIVHHCMFCGEKINH